MTTPPEFIDEQITELQNEMQNIRGILYGDKRRNETSGMVQALGQLARNGEERDRRLERIEQSTLDTANAVARIEAQLTPVIDRVNYQERNVLSATLARISTNLWVIVAVSPILISEWRNEYFGSQPWLWFGLLVLAAGIATGASLALRKNGVH